MVAAYDITPVRRFQCLPTKPIDGLYRPCTREAYQFTAVAKGTRGPTFVFYTGYLKGDELLKVLGQALPPLETWETVPGHGGVSVAPTPGTPPPGTPAPAKVCAFNASLLQLLNLFFLRYEFNPTKPSGQIFMAINQNPAVPYYPGVWALNNVLLSHKETSAGLVTWLSAQVGSAQVRTFNFGDLHTYLKSHPKAPATIAI